MAVPPLPSSMKGMVDVTGFGAKGDGKTDDTAAIQKAIDSLPATGGVVCFPPGKYSCRTIKGRSFTTLLGFASWSYNNDGSTALIAAADDLKCLLDLDECVGTRVVGLSLNGRRAGKSMHGIYLRCPRKPRSEQNVVIDDCRISNFSGAGIRMEDTWVWLVRHSIIKGCGTSGIDCEDAKDGWVIDNQIAACRDYGIRGGPMAAVTITSDRIEWNGKGGIWLGPGPGHWPRFVSICNCYFDANFGPSVTAVGPDQPKVPPARMDDAEGTAAFLESRPGLLAVTGNIIRDSGWSNARGRTPRVSPDDCQVRFSDVLGLTFTGNSVLACKRSQGTTLPSRGLVIERLTDGVIVGNSLFHSATKEWLVDKGGHRNTVIANNAGSLVQPPDVYPELH